MIRQAFDKQELALYVGRLRTQLGEDKLQQAADRASQQIAGQGDAVAKLRAALPSIDENYRPSSGGNEAGAPFLARDPMISLIQSSLESKLRDKGAVDETPVDHSLFGEVAHTLERLLHPKRFTNTDPEWVSEIGEAMLDHLAKGNHAFNQAPARYEISDAARIVVVGDWGTGLPRARAVAQLMALKVDEARKQGRDAHVIHLGDVYYSGLPEEVERNVLPYWPVTPKQATEGVTSWSLNGNHDMYGGGFGYFETLLGDERFGSQRSSDGNATSFFQLTSPSWNFVGLDTSWDPDVLTFGKAGVLEAPQADFVADAASDAERKLVLLSHHQLTSVYDVEDIADVLPSKLAPILDPGRVTAWLWGHEHRCMAFNADHGVRFPRCLGNGGVPVLMNHAVGQAVPSPGAWEARGVLVEGGEHWARFGFATLDVEGDRITIRYWDDQGSPALCSPTHGEQIS